MPDDVNRTRWLSENVVQVCKEPPCLLPGLMCRHQKFTGRYHNPVGAAEPIDPNKRQEKLQSLFNAVAQVGFDRAQSEMVFVLGFTGYPGELNSSNLVGICFS